MQFRSHTQHLTIALAAFYSPLSRFWELLIGAMLAYIVLYKKDLASRWSNSSDAISIIGLSLFIIGVVWLAKSSLFPGWWALLPTLGAAFLIFAGPNAWVNRHILSNRILVWFGLISFPLYLWHWPLLSFARITQGEVSVELRFILVVASIGLAWLTYRFVESAIRKGGHNRMKVVALVLLMILVGYAGWGIYDREGLEFRYRKMIPLPTEMKHDFEKWEDKGMYPVGSCNPSFVFPKANICLQSSFKTSPDTVVWGDSHAFHAYWGVAKSLGKQGHNVELIGRGGCSFFQYRNDRECYKTFANQSKWIVGNKNIKTVIIIHRNYLSNQSSSEDLNDYTNTLSETLNQLIGEGKSVIYFMAVPELRFNPRMCIGTLPLGRSIALDKCNYLLNREQELQKTYKLMLDKVLEKYPTVKVFDPSSILCRNGKCGAVKDGLVMYTDDNHISESASYLQGEALLNFFKK